MYNVEICVQLHFWLQTTRGKDVIFKWLYNTLYNMLYNTSYNMLYHSISRHLHALPKTKPNVQEHRLVDGDDRPERSAVRRECLADHRPSDGRVRHGIAPMLRTVFGIVRYRATWWRPLRRRRHSPFVGSFRRGRRLKLVIKGSIN